MDPDEVVSPSDESCKTCQCRVPAVFEKKMEVKHYVVYFARKCARVQLDLLLSGKCLEVSAVWLEGVRCLFVVADSSIE